MKIKFCFHEAQKETIPYIPQFSKSPNTPALFDDSQILLECLTGMLEYAQKGKRYISIDVEQIWEGDVSFIKKIKIKTKSW